MSNRPERSIRREPLRTRTYLGRLPPSGQVAGSSRAKAYRPARGICSRVSGVVECPISSLATFEHLAD